MNSNNIFFKIVVGVVLVGYMAFIFYQSLKGGIAYKKEFENFIESNMQQALDSQCFEMVLQPKMNLQTNSVIAAEALVRWRLEDGTYLPPSSFVDIFEKNRFCSKLDFYMLKKAIQQIRKWIDMGINPVNISVNQSKIVFYHENYISELKSLLEEYNVSGSYITLEVLESTVIEDIDIFNSILTEVKKFWQWIFFFECFIKITD